MDRGTCKECEGKCKERNRIKHFLCLYFRNRGNKWVGTHKSAKKIEIKMPQKGRMRQ